MFRAARDRRHINTSTKGTLVVLDRARTTMEIHLFISLLALQLVLLFALVIVEITAVVYPWLLRKPKAFDYFGISLLLRFGVRV